MRIYDFQYDGHRLLVDESPDGDLELTPYCPGLADGHVPWCRVSTVYGGLLRPTLDPAVWCGLDERWRDPIDGWLAEGHSASSLTPGVWQIAWRWDTGRDEPVWKPWAQVVTIREAVAA